MSKVDISDGSFDLPDGGQWQGPRKVVRVSKRGYQGSNGYLVSVDKIFQQVESLQSNNVHEVKLKATNPRKGIDCSVNVQYALL